MRQPIKLIVRKGKVRNDGTALICLQYCYSAQQRVVLSTGKGIPLQFWNRKTGRISKDLPAAYGNVQQLEMDITEKLRKAEDMVTYALKVMEEEVDAVYLTWKQLSLIYHLDLSKNSNLEKYRDLFVLGCLTGFRFSDYSDIKPEEVSAGMLYVIQTKTLSTVVVPLRSDAKKILIEKYNMQMPQVSNLISIIMLRKWFGLQQLMK